MRASIHPVVRLAAFALAAAGGMFAQDVISAKAGLVYFVAGRVSIAGGGLLASGRTNYRLNQGEILLSETGRAEVLLNPGTVLRIGDNTRILMGRAELTDTRIFIEAGSAVVTVRHPPKLDRVEIHIGGAVVAIKGPGLYRFDASRLKANSLDPPGPWVRVYRGQAVATGSAGENSASKVTATRGQAVRLPGLRLSKFDLSDSDSLQQWAEKQGTPPPVAMMPPMRCYSNPLNTADLVSWIKECKGR